MNVRTSRRLACVNRMSSGARDGRIQQRSWRDLAGLFPQQGDRRFRPRRLRAVADYPFELHDPVERLRVARIELDRPPVFEQRGVQLVLGLQRARVVEMDVGTRSAWRARARCGTRPFPELPAPRSGNTARPSPNRRRAHGPRLAERLAGRAAAEQRDGQNERGDLSSVVSFRVLLSCLSDGLTPAPVEIRKLD